MAWSYVYTNGYPTIDATNNATLIYNKLTGAGVSAEAACAIIGNFQHESGLNTGQWQHAYSVGDWNSAGFGLGQWTPASKIYNYIGGAPTEAQLCDGDTQLDYLLSNTGQWSTKLLNSNGTSSYYGLTGVPYYATFSSFLTATDTPEDLATAFMVCWERCSNRYQYLDTRKNNARYWYDLLSQGSTTGGYPINVQIEGNGSVTQSAYKAYPNDTVTLTANANAGATFIEWDSISGNISIVADTSNPLSFTMPSTPVTIKASFTGQTPVEPSADTALSDKGMPIFMYPMFRM